jgi:hypothetical protein
MTNEQRRRRQQSARRSRSRAVRAARFKDPQLDAVLRRALDDAMGWADGELRPPVRGMVLANDFDHELNSALNLLSYGQENDEPDFTCAGIYALLLMALQSVRATRVDASMVVAQGRALLEELSEQMSEPVMVSSDMMDHIEGLADVCGYQVETRTGMTGRLKGVVISRANDEDADADGDGASVFVAAGRYLMVTDGGEIIASDSPDGGESRDV